MVKLQKSAAAQAETAKMEAEDAWSKVAAAWRAVAELTALIETQS